MRERDRATKKTAPFPDMYKYHTFAFGEYSTVLPLRPQYLWGKRSPPPPTPPPLQFSFIMTLVTSVPNICINKWSRQC